MKKELNLCEILKGHEGESFYSPIFGDLTLLCILSNTLKFATYVNDKVTIYSNGKFYKRADRIAVYPSKHLDDWNKWDKENNTQPPKTWNELSREVKSRITAIKDLLDYGLTDKYTLIEKSAFALLKIRQLIEFGYGGNVTYNCFENQVTYGITYCGDSNSFEVYQIADIYEYSPHIHFHTKEQAEEFLSYDENIQLLREYYMV